MKKMISVLLAICLLLCLAACGNSANQGKTVDVAAVYAGFEKNMPDMFYPDDTTLLDFLGIHAEDCAQYKVAICAEGLRADEIWLLEAKDDAAMEKLTNLANMRIQSKLDETETYAPDQYLVVQKAQVITKGHFLALVISPDVDTLKATIENAFA